MLAAGVPTAAFGSFDEVAAAEAFIDAQPGDVVVKADGLCAGKGVVVTSSHAEARAAVREMLGDRKFGAAGARVVIEERLIGPEVSMMAFCDGDRFALLASAEDHKAVGDGDQGPEHRRHGRLFARRRWSTRRWRRASAQTHLRPHGAGAGRGGAAVPRAALRRADVDRDAGRW